MVRELLMEKDAQDLVAYEEIIEKHQEGFLACGFAVLSIRERKLYKSRYDTFDDYCRDRWGWSKTHVNRMVQAVEVSRDLTPRGVILPVTEKQSRPLAQLPSEDRAEAWEEAQERAASDQPPARIVSEVVKERKAKNKAKVATPPKASEFVEVKTTGATDEEVEAQKEAAKERQAIQQESKTQDQLDDEYIKSLPLYGQLKDQQLRNFVADVRIWMFARREIEAARKKLSEACNKFRVGRYGHRARWFFKTDAPEKWIRCADPSDGGCGGTGYRHHGTTQYECPECKKDGYRING